jgi:hypothetical protein
VKRPRIKLQRPAFKLRRPGFGRSAAKPKTAEKPKDAEKPKKAKAAKPKKDPADDLWFRVSTRVRALGYGIREKAQQAWRLLRKAGEWTADLWLKRSREGRIRIVAVAGVLALYVVVKFAPVPGVPCTVSAYHECAPPDQAIELVPADALLYAHLTIDEDSTQFKRATDAFDRLADLQTILAAELPAALPTPSGASLDIRTDVLPWADRDLAVALIDGPKKTSVPVFIVGIGDREGAEQFLTTIAPPGAPQAEQQGNAALSVYTGGFAAAYIDDSGSPSIRAPARFLASRTRRRTRPATSFQRRASPSSTSPARASSALSSTEPAPRPSSRPSSTTGRPAGSPRPRSRARTGWRSIWSAASTRSS